MIARIEISRDLLIQNIQSLRAHLAHVDKKVSIISVVKAQAYGIGLREVVSCLDGEVDAWGVDDIDELYALRFLTEKDVYMLGYTAHEDMEKLLMLRGIPVVYDIETLRCIDKTAEFLEMTADIHVKIDALLGRQGLIYDEIDEFLAELQILSHVRLRGLYGHFADLEDTDEGSYAQTQLEAYQEALRVFEKAGFTQLETHISATAGAVLGLDSYTHVRIGIGMYGIWPSDAIKKEYSSKIQLKPVVRWLTQIAQVKKIQAGRSIGYGRTFIAENDKVVAVIPQGYSDGYNRLLSNSGEVLIHGTRCPVLGRVAMNMFVVDVTHIEGVAREDEVVLLGTQGDEEISAEEIAHMCQTIPYEVLTWLNPLLPRRVIMTSRNSETQKPRNLGI